MNVEFNFEPDAKFPQKMQHSVGMLKLFSDTADEVAQAARVIAPFLTGAYMRSIEPMVGYDTNGYVMARVNAWDYKAWWIEVGTEETEKHGRTPAFAPLRLGADAVGLHLGPGGTKQMVVNL